MLSREQCNELYQRHAPSAFRRAQQLLGNVSDADDVVHDVFMALFQQYERYRGTSSLSTYVYSAVTHACLNRIRNRKRRAVLSRLHFSAPTFDAGTAAESAVAARSLLEGLPSPLAEVAVYYYIDELSQREIAGLLGCSHTHVAELIARISRWASEQELAVCQR